MCVVSMVMDHYQEKWGQGQTGIPNWQPQIQIMPQQQVPSAEEIAEFRKLLERAREYDKRNNEPACELQEKKDTLLTIAKALGVDISFINEDK